MDESKPHLPCYCWTGSDTPPLPRKRRDGGEKTYWEETEDWYRGGSTWCMSGGMSSGVLTLVRV